MCVIRYKLILFCNKWGFDSALFQAFAFTIVVVILSLKKIVNKDLFNFSKRSNVVVVSLFMNLCVCGFIILFQGRDGLGI